MPAQSNEAESPDRAVVPSSGERRERRVAVLATVLLALGTSLTAWSLFQIGEWDRVRFVESDRGDDLQSTAAAEVEAAERDALLDQGLYSDWLAARSRGDSLAAATLLGSFREPVRPLVEAWAQDLETAPAAVTNSPFDVPGYDVNRRVSDAAETSDAGAELHARGLEAADFASDYALVPVMFAASLLFAGLAPHIKDRHAQNAMLAIAAVVIVVGGLVIARLPVQL